MTRLSKIFTTLLIAMVCAISGSAQQHGRKPDSEPTIKIETTLISVPVIVCDRQGRYIGGLKASDFTLYDDRVKRSIDFFAASEEPINIALLLDTSKSTTLVLPEIKQAAKDFIKQLRPQDRSMIVSFDNAETALCELTSDHRVLERAIDRARIGEGVGTKLRDAVIDVMKTEFKGVKGRKAIVLLTDGKDYGSEASEQSLLDSAAEADTMIYSVFYTSLPGWMARIPRKDRGGWDSPGGWRRRRAGRIEERNEAAIDFLQNLSEVSAGRFYRSEVANLNKTFEQIVEELRHQYRLGFYPPDNPADQPIEGIHSIKVEVAIPNTVVRSRRSYRITRETQDERR